jgi:hypothetical protein
MYFVFYNFPSEISIIQLSLFISQRTTELKLLSPQKLHKNVESKVVRYVFHFRYKSSKLSQDSK